MVKTFVLRSHSLIRTPDATLRFDSDNEIVIPEPVLGDLSRISKEHYSEKSILAKQVLDYLDSLDIKKLYSKDGVQQSNGSRIRIVDGYEKQELVPADSTSNSAKYYSPKNSANPAEKFDYRCLQIALGLMKEEKKTVIIVSQNPVLRMKAKKLGIKAETFKDELFPPLKEQYAGREIGITSMKHIEDFKTKGILNPNVLRNYKEINFYPNLFIVLQDYEKTLSVTNTQTSVIGRFDGKKIVSLNYREYHPFKTTEKTVGQVMLKEALMQDPDKAPVVIVKGNAGTGKTFETLAVALDQLEEGVYDQIVVTAPTETVGQERLGFLPGGIDSKFDPHIGGIHDNVRILYLNYKGKHYEAIQTAYVESEKANSQSDNTSQTQESDELNSANQNKKTKRRQKNYGNNNNGTSNRSQKPKNPIQAAFDEQRQKYLDGSYLFETQQIVIQPIGYLRGRTFLRTLFIIDETQNIYPPIIKSIITREGIGSKFVFLGDPTQIDNPELNERYNGLTFFGERTKEDEDVWLITLTEDESVRSKIAKKMAMYL